MSKTKKWCSWKEKRGNREIKGEIGYGRQRSRAFHEGIIKMGGFNVHSLDQDENMDYENF